MKHLLMLLAAAILITSCEQRATLVQDKELRRTIKERIAERDWLPALPEDLTAEETEAMKFLYAFMPIGDIADYSQSLILENVRSSFQTRNEMSWGSTISDELFLFYILPVRVGNEALDNSRTVFYAELKDRVKDLSMADAIKEVNHWCHGKVVYSSTDARTSSPLATVRAAFGRCGEEAVLTVAALRAVGIPARQIYTPRWAHTDDNHAWVEAWADGQWYFLGACEPDASLNAGWFTGPASRALLISTRVFGDYNGPEEVITRNNAITEINVTSHYTSVSNAVVLVKDKEGNPVQDANVIFSIYNYAEFYPAVRKKTDAQGTVNLNAGKGTMMIWANNGSDFGYELFKFGSGDTLTVVMNKKGKTDYSIDLDIVPPYGSPGELKSVPATEAQREAFGMKMRRGDSMRRAHVATFMDKATAFRLAEDIGADTLKTWQFISKSRGNWREIEKFMRSVTKDQLPVAMQLLGVVPDKDLRDTPVDVFTDHLEGAMQYSGRPFFVEYILNPRIANELLTAYRMEFSSVGGCASVDELINTARTIKIRPDLNQQNLSITPMGAYRMGIADMPAVERFVIALIRSHGVPARREPITLRPQYYDLNTEKWINIQLSDSSPKPAPRGTLDLAYTPESKDDDPQYYARFTLAKLTNGEYKTVDMSATVAADMGAGISFRNLFKQPLELEESEYYLITGTRLGDGTVLGKIDFFPINAGQQTSREMIFRQESKELEIIGSYDPSSTVIIKDVSEPKSLASLIGGDYFVLVVLEPKKEPTNHVMRDIVALKPFLDQWGGKVVFLFRNDAEAKMFDLADFGELPANAVFATDNEGQTVNMFKEKLNLEDIGNLPLVTVANNSGDVVFLSQGYTIGIGRHIMSTLKKTEEKKKK